MASIGSSVASASLSSHNRSATVGMMSIGGGGIPVSGGKLGFPSLLPARPRRSAADMKASVSVQPEAINLEIRKDEEKVVDSVVVSDLSKPLTAYCRCWRSRTFPLCDGTHVKHNKATGDNVGPLLLKKQ